MQDKANFKQSDSVETPPEHPIGRPAPDLFQNCPVRLWRCALTKFRNQSSVIGAVSLQALQSRVNAHMLARLARTSRLHLVRPVVTPTGPRTCRQSLACLSSPGHGAQLAHSVQSTAADKSAPVWPQDLKAQILQSAKKIRFRYEIDNHKIHSDAALDDAEKAIGYLHMLLQCCASMRH